MYILYFAFYRLFVELLNLLCDPDEQEALNVLTKNGYGYKHFKSMIEAGNGPIDDPVLQVAADFYKTNTTWRQTIDLFMNHSLESRKHRKKVSNNNNTNNSTKTKTKTKTESLKQHEYPLPPFSTNKERSQWLKTYNYNVEKQRGTYYEELDVDLRKISRS